ncbi:ATP-binding cassette domain-containing protein [Thiohalomonas denitrificans]|uniref:ABC-2 type transport system ATP-binding protein n=1 Tax=Thiohalomonas denitrificans TaxID=415747 RepID=A0A1G5Q1D6_9GAMM|nr:ATP-binding cassette domain-containing protein [Thiohalomonas denitrificans]SCZ55613.1 ABC-2 type transport system ATP-binding protein [Thiohalomonas denitrificans]
MTSRKAAPAVQFSDVYKSFAARGKQTRALNGVSFAADSGSVTGLVGPDGAGKTTLMRLAAGLLAPDRGEIQVLEMDATGDALAVQSVLGYMPQRFGLYEDLTVRENLNLYADLQGVPVDQREERYRELMHMTGLGSFTARLAGRLSGGMKQKLGLACTLVRSPHALILDEPTVGVDPVSRRELWTIIDRLVRDEGLTVLLSTAYLDEAERCSRVVLLHEGEVLGEGSPDSFSRQLRGRTYLLQSRLRGRQVQARLQGRRAVTDVVVAGGRVRLVLEPDSDPGEFEGEGSVQPVPPRFEDSFVALLRERRGAPSLPEMQQHTIAGRGEDAVIAVRDLTRRFGDFYAVKGLTFSVHRGEVFGLLGANGAGKSTTFRMLCGLLPASGGTLRVAGVDLRHAAAEARARIGYMSQKFSLYGILSVEQNLDFFARSYGLGRKRRDERIRWALEQFELEELRESASDALSLGHKQRLAMACALMHEPDILFLDEPTSGVDPLARREFWLRINALAEANVTIMVTTHFMEEAEYCDRLAIMAAGEILELGTPAEIKSSVAPKGREPSLEEAFITLIERRDTEA